MKQQLNLFTDQQPAYKEGDVVNGKRVVRTKHGDLQLVPITGKTKEQYIEQARQLWGDKYDYTDSVYVENKKPIIIYCPKHDYHFRVSMAQNHILKPKKGFKPTGCPICAAEQLHKTEYGTDWRKYLKLCARNNRAGLIDNVGRQKLTEKEKARRKAERDAATAERQRIRKEERRKAFEEKLAAQKAETQRRREERKAARAIEVQQRKEERERQRVADLQERFRREAQKKQGEGYQYRGIENITTTTSLVDVHCPNPDHQWHPMRVDLILQGCNCRECAGRHQTLEQRCQMFIDNCIEKYGPNRYDYSRAHEDYVNNDSLVWIRCCIHNKWFQTTPDNNLRTVVGSCPICALDYKESEGEAEIRRWLVKHGIFDFKQDEVTIDHHNPRCKRQYLRPDFWLPGYNLFIEYNGEQHYKEVNIFNDGDWTFEDQQIRDQTLRDYCHKHRINLLEIPYWDFKRIDEILSEYLYNSKNVVTLQPEM